MDCDQYNNGNEIIAKKAKLLIASVVKKYSLTVFNGMERLLTGNNSEHLEFTSEVFNLTEI